MNAELEHTPEMGTEALRLSHQETYLEIQYEDPPTFDLRGFGTKVRVTPHLEIPQQLELTGVRAIYKVYEGNLDEVGIELDVRDPLQPAVDIVVGPIVSLMTHQDLVANGRAVEMMGHFESDQVLDSQMIKGAEVAASRVHGDVDDFALVRARSREWMVNQIGGVTYAHIMDNPPHEATMAALAVVDQIVDWPPSAVIWSEVDAGTLSLDQLNPILRQKVLASRYIGVPGLDIDELVI